MEYQRQTKINASLQKVHFFMREVKNLPIWARFFKSCNNCNEVEGEMETALGKSLTFIKEERLNSSIKLLICSKFTLRQEQASVVIEGDKKQTAVTFYLSIPPEVNEDKHEKMLLNLEEELAVLKKYLESSNVR